MQYEVVHRPSYALAIIKLDPGEQLKAEPGAMVSMSANVQIDTGVQGGLMAGLKRSLLGGESFFMNTFAAPQGGEVTLAPPLPGDIAVRELNNDTLLVQSGSFLASAPGVNIDTTWGGAKTFFASEGLILLRCSGSGPLVISSYGAIHEMQLEAGQSYIVDTGHLVAFSEGMPFRVQRAGNWKSTLLGGEGLVVELTGPGTLMLQTRSTDAFLAWLLPKIPRQKSDEKGVNIRFGS